MTFTSFQRRWVIGIILCLMVFGLCLSIFMKCLNNAREVERDTRDLKELLRRLRTQMELRNATP